jgi:uncharacterized protein YjbI with pentapeptide repeats
MTNLSFMSSPRLLISRAGLTTQEVLADEFSVENQIIFNESLNNLNLTGINFNEVKIDSCFFIKNDFTGDHFYSTEINKTKFTNCDFTNCEFYDILFIGCIFVDCAFEKGEFYDCLFKACTFLRTNMNWSYHSSSRFTEGRMSNLMKMTFRKLKYLLQRLVIIVVL